jgi:hypothetical protein
MKAGDLVKITRTQIGASTKFSFMALNLVAIVGS